MKGQTGSIERRRRHRGQGLVEFALILPVLLLVIIGTLEFGRILFIYVNVTNAAREGARYGLVHPRDPQGIDDVIEQRLALVDGVQPVITCDNGPPYFASVSCQVAVPGDRIGVAINHTVQPVTTILQPIMPEGLAFSTESWRTIQYVRSVSSLPINPAPFPPPPEPPALLTIDEPLYAGSTMVSGAGEPGEFVELTWNSTPVASTQIAEDGTFQFSLPGVLEIGDVVIVMGYGQDDQAIAVGDPLYILGPVVAGDTVVEGTGTPGATIELTINGEPAGTTEIQADGTFSFTGLDTLIIDDVVTVSGYGSQDSLTVVGEPIVITEPLTAGDTVVRGTGQAGNEIEIDVGDGRIYETTIGAGGAFSLDVPDGLYLGRLVIVTGYGTRAQALVGGEPIQIDAVAAYDTVVTGQGQPSLAIRLYINDSRSYDGEIDAAGNFSFEVPPLDYGDVIRVIGYGSEDTATVPGAPAPITINEVTEGDITVIGTAEPTRELTLFVTQTGLQRTVTVGEDGVYGFADLPSMVAGYTIVVSGYDEEATTTVVAADTSGAYLEIDPAMACLEPGETSSLTVRVRQPGDASYYNLYLDDVLQNSKAVKVAEPLTLEITPPLVDAPSSYSIHVDLLGPNKTDILGTIDEQLAVCVSPDAEPDLVVSDLTVLNADEIATYEPIYTSVTVENVGLGDVTSLFWVVLYKDYNSRTIAERAAFTSMVVGEPVSFTMVIEDGYTELGTYRIVAEVDPWDQIGESNEGNNLSSTEIITITEGGTPPEPTPGPITDTVGTLVGFVDIGGTSQAGVEVSINASPAVDPVYTGEPTEEVPDPDPGYFQMENVPVGTWLISASVVVDNVYYFCSQPVTVVEGDNPPLFLSLTALTTSTSSSSP